MISVDNGFHADRKYLNILWHDRNCGNIHPRCALGAKKVVWKLKVLFSQYKN